MESLLTLLSQYYGIDWLSSLIGLMGLYLISEKRPFGFLCTLFSVLLAATVAIMANQYGFLLANVVTAGLAVRGYIKWQNGH